MNTSCKISQARNYVLIPGNTAQILPKKENNSQSNDDHKNVRIVQSPLSEKRNVSQLSQKPSGTSGNHPPLSLSKNVKPPKGAPNPKANAPRRIEVKPPLNANHAKNPRTTHNNTLRITPDKSIYVFMDRNSALPALSNKNSDKYPDIAPIAIQLSNLANKGISYVSSNPGCINIITDKNEFFVSQTVVNEERNSFAKFEIPQNFIRSAFTYLSVSCGAEHTIVCATKDNKFFVFGLGSNTYGQLGLKRQKSIAQFQQIELPSQLRFSQAICGKFYTFLLTDTGQVFSFGHNKQGQLGLGLSNDIVPIPTFCNSLNGAPIIDIACGSTHTLALSSTGTIFAAGSNSQGQLGLSSQYDQQMFRIIDTLANVYMVYITAQECFSAAIDEFGTLYVWGGKWGFSPQVLSFEIDDNQNSNQLKAVDVALGLNGRIAVLTSNNKLILSGYYVNEIQVTQMVDIVSPSSPFVKVFSGGEYFFALTSKSQSLPLSFENNREDASTNLLSLLPRQPIELKDRLRSSKRILSLFSYHFPAILTVPTNKEIIHLVFSSLSSINTSFTIQNFNEDMASISSGIDINGVINAFNSLLYQQKELLQILTSSFCNLLEQLIKVPPSIKRPTNMRFLLIGLLHPSTSSFEESFKFWTYLVTMIERMNAYSILAQWISVLDRDFILRILDSLKDFLGMQTTKLGNLYSDEIVKSVKAIQIIWSASTRTKKLSFEHFYHEQINEKMDIKIEYSLAMQSKERSKNSYSESNQIWCYTGSAPFLLNADTKTNFLRHCSEKKQEKKFDLSLQMIEGNLCLVVRKKVFELKVNRKSILDDTYNQIFKLEDPKTELKKKLMVTFENEPAVDAGGVQREFFELIVNELVSKEKKLFVTVGDFYWFNKDATDPKSLQYYKLAGIIIGMGIYNGNLINIRFPTIVYKRLKKMNVDFKDLNDYDSEIYNSLQSILKYEGDVSDLCLYFEYGGVPLVEGGSDKPVTNGNREEYVEAVSKYILCSSVELQFNKFREGVTQCVGKNKMKLFKPEELALLVAGREDLDFYALMKATKYDNGFTADSPTVRAFWRIVFTRLTDEEKKKLIFFVTASPRAPIGGLGAVPFVIAKDSDKNHVPQSHTCFCMLVLPDEPDDDKLYKKLMIAIENSEGFQFK